MQIVMKGEDFNEMMKLCSKAVGGDENRPQLQRIRITKDEDEVVAEACDGYVYTRMKVEAEGENGAMLLPVIGRVEKEASVVIVDEGENIQIHDGEKTIMYPSINSKEWPDMQSTLNSRLEKEEKGVVCVSGAFLAKLAREIGKRDMVRLRVSENLESLLIENSNKGKMGLIMPVHDWSEAK